METQQQERANKIKNLAGFEPEPMHYSDVLNREVLIRSLNWYSYSKDRKDAILYMETYLKKHLPEDYKKWNNAAENFISSTWCWVARMKSRGSTFDNSLEKRFQEHIQEALSKKKIKEVEATQEEIIPKKTVKDYTLEKQAEFLGELEGHIDDIIVNGKIDIDLYQYAKEKELPKNFMQSCIELIQRLIDEIQDNECEQRLESWEHLSTRPKKNIINNLIKLQDQARKYADFKKSVRKERVKKERPASKQVERIKFCPEVKDLNIKSINPVHLIGATQCWIYNIKYNKIGVYHSLNPKGFTAKGSHIENWDPETSKQKKIKKPDQVIGSILNLGKVALRKVLDEIKSKEYPMNGSFNENIIILRVI